MPSFLRGLALLLAVPLGPLPSAAAQEAPMPRLAAHRGLLRHAPENTLAAYAACLELRLSFELDVRRTRDGHLVCLHDENVKRTTNGRGNVQDMTLAELRQLDAGAWFDPVFAGERVPTLDEVFTLLRPRWRGRALPGPVILLDLKVDDANLEKDVVALAKKHGLLDKVLCIGRAISEAAVRRKLRQADPNTPVAVLAHKPEDLPAALADKDSSWIYVRFVPTPEQRESIRKAGKQVILVGPLVMGHEPANWRRARDAGVDAILTDFPLDCRRALRTLREGK
jgi:glycerophosphoryl diester phosphodiesterase